MKRNKKLILISAVSLFIILTTLVSLSKSATAKANDLIINDSGSVDLIITDGSAVLAASTTAPAAQTPAVSGTSPQPPAPAATAAPKVIQVAPPNSNTTVKISPNTSSDKKLNITIETTKNQPTKTNSSTTAATKTPSNQNGQTTTKGSPAPTATANPANIQSTQKSVDNVILRNANQEPVVTINADKKQADQINIEQQNVTVSTDLPVQIDTKTHEISVQTTTGPSPLLVLPDQAVSGAEQKSITSFIPTISTQVSLKDNNGQAEYVINEVKKADILGVVNLTIPSQVKVSAQTGKTISTWQPSVVLFPGLFK